MEAFDFSVPGVFFGNGELRRLQEIAPTTGKIAMLLAAKQTMKQTGILDRAVEPLNKGSVDVVVSDNLDPDLKTVAFLAAQGGGTILDYLAGGPHVGYHEHEMARETGNGQRQHHGELRHHGSY